MFDIVWYRKFYVLLSGFSLAFKMYFNIGHGMSLPVLMLQWAGMYEWRLVDRETMLIGYTYEEQWLGQKVELAEEIE